MTCGGVVDEWRSWKSVVADSTGNAIGIVGMNGHGRQTPPASRKG